MTTPTALSLAALLLIACKHDPPSATNTTPPVASGDPLSVSSDAWPQGGVIPTAFTCDGADKSPVLAWSGAPASAKSFALIVDDPDAPSGTFTHWVLFDVPANTNQLAESSSGVGINGKNDFGNARYNGPCPPKGKGAHRYFFKVFALDAASLGLSAGASRGEVEGAMKSHVLASGTRMGTFGH